MFNKKKFKKLGNKIVELKISLSTMQILYDSITDRLNKNDGEKNKERVHIVTIIEKINRRVEELKKVVESDTNSIVNLSNKLGEKDKMIESLREEVSEVRAVTKELLKTLGHEVKMEANKDYMKSHLIKVTKINNKPKTNL